MLCVEAAPPRPRPKKKADNNGGKNALRLVRRWRVTRSLTNWSWPITCWDPRCLGGMVGTVPNLGGGLVCHGDFFPFFFSGVQFLRDVFFGGRWYNLRVCFSYVFFGAAIFLNWKLSNLTIGTLLKLLKPQIIRATFLFQFHMARAMVWDCPLMHANPRSSINGSLSMCWTCSNGGVVWPKFRQLATTVTIYSLQPSHLTHLTLEWERLPKFSWHVALSMTP